MSNDPGNGKDNRQWSRWRWIGTAPTPERAASLWQWLTCVLAFSVLLAPAHVAMGASTISLKVTTPTTGAAVWRLIPDPANPGRFLKSQVTGGTVLAVQAAGAGRRTATWTATGLQAGYYKIELLYPKHSGNSKSVLVLTRGTLDSGFKARSHRLNQQIGDSDQIVSNKFANTVTNVTKYGTSNANTYIWVGNNASNQPYTGELSIQLSDSGSGSTTVPGGRIVADTVRLTLISTTK